jgi:hypothetical protein
MLETTLGNLKLTWFNTHVTTFLMIYTCCSKLNFLIQAPFATEEKERKLEDMILIGKNGMI